LTGGQREQLGDILDSGPVAYGLDTGIWTSPIIAWVIEQEFGVHYHPGHVRKLLHYMVWISRYSVRVGFWLGPMPPHKIAGIATPIPI
jgi:hypothetical protein